jgi:hypothetical protein
MHAGFFIIMTSHTHDAYQGDLRVFQHCYGYTFGMLSPCHDTAIINCYDTANGPAIDAALTLSMCDLCLYLLQRSEVVALINEKRRHAMMQLKASLAEVGGSHQREDEGDQIPATSQEQVLAAHALPLVSIILYVGCTGLSL